MAGIKRTGSCGAAIRAAADGDAGAVIALWTEGYVREGGGRTVPYVEAEFEETMREARVFVAEQRGSVAGVVALLAPGSPGAGVASAGEAELSRLAVAASAQRQGIGRKLVDLCVRTTAAEGWTAIALWSRRYQTAAHRLYESLGFRRVPERDTTDKTSHERLVFRLLL